MTTILTILFAGLITDNIVIAQSWGLCPFLGVSKKTNSAVSMGLAVTLVLIIVTPISYGMGLFLSHFGYGYLQILLNILVIASIVQLLEITLKRLAPSLYKSLGIYLPLITTNCAIFAVASSIGASSNFFTAWLTGISAGLGFLLALIVMSAIRERVAKSDIPKPLQGFPVALITASLMALAFAGFAGL